MDKGQNQFTVVKDLLLPSREENPSFGGERGESSERGGGEMICREQFIFAKPILQFYEYFLSTEH